MTDKKICIFTQTYSDDRKILFYYHNLDKEDIYFRNHFDNIYAFHNCSDEYVDEIKNYDYFKNINNIRYIRYSGITYTESFKETLILIRELGYDYIIFIQDDSFTDNYKNFDNLIKYIKNEDFLMLNIEIELEIITDRDSKILYQDDDFIVYNTNSEDFSENVSCFNIYDKELLHYWQFDDGPYVANLNFICDNIYDEEYYNNFDNIQDAENYLMRKIMKKPISRYSTNTGDKYKFIYRRRNIIGPSDWVKQHETMYLDDRFKKEVEQIQVEVEVVELVEIEQIKEKRRLI